jgi:hypothetical protein
VHQERINIPPEHYKEMTTGLLISKTVKELQNYLSVDNRTSQVRAIPGEGLDIPI